VYAVDDCVTCSGPSRAHGSGSGGACSAPCPLQVPSPGDRLFFRGGKGKDGLPFSGLEGALERLDSMRTAVMSALTGDPAAPINEMVGPFCLPARPPLDRPLMTCDRG
jgi:hypothetical protein